MADFTSAYETVLKHEGKYSNDSDDPGGETYKGISRNNWGSWKGWPLIDLQKQRPDFPGNLEKDMDLQAEVKQFYLDVFWNPLGGDAIKEQAVARSVFDFAINAGLKTCVVMVQTVVDADPDGVMGPNTLQAVNAANPDHFLASFALARIVRYITVVKKRPTSQKYFFGWVCRTLEIN